MKKLPLVLLSTVVALSLSACGSTTTASGDLAACKHYWFQMVGACLPDNWNVLEQSDLNARGVAEDTVIAFQAKDASSGQFPTVTITREPLASVVDPVAYSDATMRSVAVLPNYKLIDKKKTTLDGTALQVHVFYAQPAAGEPQRRFYQVSTTVDRSGYTITALTPVTVPSALEKEVLTIIGSITFKQPSSANGS